jgi:hypothetical protein
LLRRAFGFSAALHPIAIRSGRNEGNKRGFYAQIILSFIFIL